MGQKRSEKMKTEPLDFGGYTVEIVKKKIKNIYFRVYPSKEKIIVSAPVRIDPATLNKAILSKKEWIFKQVKKGVVITPDPVIRTYADGEEFLFKGKTYSLHVDYKDIRPGVFIFKDGCIHLVVKPCSDACQKETVLDAWYRNELKQSIAGVIEKWQPVMDVTVNSFNVRKMKTRWGSCNVKARRIWLNFSLIHLPDIFLEYVVVHEMVHLLERKHNARFKGFMDQFIPGWRHLKKQLNQFRL